jgi:hypothetical protein
MTPQLTPADREVEGANQRIDDIASGEPPGFALGSSLPVEMTGDRSAEYEWAEQIKSAWQKSVEGIIECGRLLIVAKAALPHGRFEAMVAAELPFSKTTVERLMAIARDGRLINPAHVPLLPPHWGTLHALTKLDPEEFEEKLADGTINPDMTRADAKSNMSRPSFAGRSVAPRRSMLPTSNSQIFPKRSKRPHWRSRSSRASASRITKEPLSAPPKPATRQNRSAAGLARMREVSHDLRPGT